MAIAFVWSYIVGEFYEKIEPIKLKEKKIIERVGANKGGSWKVLELKDKS